MVSHASKIFVAALCPLILTGCVKAYTNPDQGKLTVPRPPTAENISPQGGVGGPVSRQLSKTPVMSAPQKHNGTSPLPRLKATPERPIPGQLTAQQFPSSINIREGPGPNYSVLFSAHPKDTVMITNESLGSDGYQWYQVEHDSWGWVREDLLKLDKGLATIKANHQGAIINVREGPGQNYRVIHETYGGDQFPVASQEQDASGYTWHLLDLSYRGWVRSDLMHKGTAAFK